MLLLLPFAVSSKFSQPYPATGNASEAAKAAYPISAYDIAAKKKGTGKSRQAKFAKQRKKVLDGFARTGRYIEFAPKGGKQNTHTLYIFTDVDCSYCRQLHANMGTINKLGIAVRYIPFPIIGNDIELMKKVWCSKDRRTALNQAMAGGRARAQLKEVKSCSNPINRIIELGQQMKVSSTPSIYLEDGTWMPTTMDPNRMLWFLKSRQGQS